MSHRWDLSVALLVSINSLALVCVPGCDRRSAPQPPAPSPVTVAHPIEREVIEWDEYTGRLEAVDFVDVRARVSGYLDRAEFEEGSLVKEHDLLFAIDARPFEITLARRKAETARAEAQRAYAADILQRLINARSSDAASDKEIEDARRDLLAAEADLAAAMANVAAAELDLEWSRVTAPISGRVSRKYVTRGNLINGGEGDSTLLTTIASIDPIYCIIDADEQSVLKYQRLSREGKRVSARDAQIPCYLQLSDEMGFPHAGVVDFVDNRLDPTTGTILARGRFPNTNGFLYPGYFARVRIPGSGKYQALLVPDLSIGFDQDQKFVAVVSDKNVVERRMVQTGALFGRLRVIEKGLTIEDRVVINGVQRAIPGVVVSPQDSQIPDDWFDDTASGNSGSKAFQ